MVALALLLTTPSSAQAQDTSTCVDENTPLPAGLEAVNVPRGSIRRAKTNFGTSVSLGVSGVDCAKATEAFAAVFAEFDRVEALVSTKNPDADLAKVNAAAGKAPVEVNPELFALMQLALDFAEQSGGAFDPTFAPVFALYDFKAKQAPDAEALERVLPLVNYKAVVVDEAKRTLFLPKKGMALSLGGIAQGYAIDRATAKLQDLGVDHFIFRSDGQLTVIGEPGGGGRRVGVPHPDGKGSLALLSAKNRSLNFSRDTDASFVDDTGARHHHILDPNTGAPAHHVRTVALMSHDATSADALSTAVFVMGPQRGLALVEKLRGVEALVLDDEKRIHMSSGIDDAELFAP